MFKYFIMIVLFLSITTISIKTTINDKIQNEKKYDAIHNNFYSTVTSSFSLIFLSELGDRTFFVIMIYSLSNQPFRTFILSFPSLIILNFAAISLGSALPIFLYRKMLEWIAFFIFLTLSIILLYDGFVLDYHTMKTDFIETLRKYSKHEDSEEIEDEYRNLRQELLGNESIQNISLRNLNQQPPVFDTSSAFITSLILSECGDKSQISGILIGALQDFYAIFIGTSLAFFVSIIIAISIGNYIAASVTKKSILIFTGIIYFLFALSYLLQIYGIC